MSFDEPRGSRLISNLERIAVALEELLALRRDGGRGSPLAGEAFAWCPASGFRPILRVAAADPSLLLGIERQKSVLYENVRRFLARAPAHDVLLWGDRGTGKSTLVRSLLRTFPGSDLSLVEVREPSIPGLPELLDLLERDHRRWILFLDDLSFRAPGDHYQELKILLEGGLEARPENTLAVATSNRRHLVPETFPPSGEIHPEESVAEATSLADRFGLSLGFYPFDETTFLAAVEAHVRALGCAPADGSWRLTAVRWAMARGIRSGRTALQAAKEIVGALSLPAPLSGGG
jgi:predicted AAA+ superfamily ATPase